MTMICAALLGSALLAAPPRVGVIAVGDDPGAAGELQRTIELRLSASRKLDLIDAAQIGATLPPAPPRPAGARPVDPALQKEAIGLLQQATDAYYQDRAALALERLATLATLQDRTQAFPVSERVRILLWRTAVYLALKDTAQAEIEALAALTLNPELKVDLTEFRPSVKEAVDRVRARGLRTVTILVSGLPPGATLELDDRVVSVPFKATPGRHRISASAPGRREVIRVFEVTSDVSVPMYLPFATDAATHAALKALATSSSPTRSERKIADEIASKLKLDWIVVAAAAGEARAVALAHPGSGVHVSPPSTAGNVAAWLEQHLTAVDAVAAVPTPRPARTPRPPKPPRPEGSAALAIDAAGGLAWTARDRALEAKGGAGFETSFGGVGPRVVVDASYGSPFAQLEAAWVNYGISTLDVTLPDGSDASVDGGTTVIARLHAGWRHSFAGGGEPAAAPSVFGALGISSETHTAKDVKDPDAGKLGLLTGYQRTAVEVALGGRYPFGGSLRPAISGGIVVAPVSTWTETPGNTTGKNPAPGTAFGWNLGVAITPASRLTVAVEYAGAMRSVSFEGTAKAPVDPALEDTTIDESFHTLGLTAGYRF